jgi:phosphoglycerate kinase
MSISKKTIKDIELKGKRIIMRVDFNVPMKEGIVQDDTRIKAAIPTIQYVLSEKAKSLILMSHLGDPEKDMEKAKEKAAKDGKSFDEKKYLAGKHMLKPVAEHLSKLLGKEVKFAPDALGPETKKMVDALSDGEILMLENTRFHKEETSKDSAEREKMARELASYGDIFVNDAFGTAHRAHASTETIAHFLPAVAGFLMEKELEYLEEKIVKNPVRPFIAIIGGAKVSSKINVLENLIQKVDRLIVGGGMAYTFLKAKGLSVGTSLVEDDMIEKARYILQKAYESHVYIYLPIDHIVTQSFNQDANFKYVARGNIDEGWMGMDIGPLTIEKFQGALKGAKTVFWNGPLGVFEFPKFSKGTMAIANILANLPNCITVIGGGDSISAVNKAGVAAKMSHISTGGGASLELVEGKVLPGVAALLDK